jgi:hypothetical protein
MGLACSEKYEHWSDLGILHEKGWPYSSIRSEAKRVRVFWEHFALYSMEYMEIISQKGRSRTARALRAPSPFL